MRSEAKGKAVKLAILVLVAISVYAQAVYDVCASGCTYTTAQLQTALDDAALDQGADKSINCKTALVTLKAGETFTGNYTLRAKPCNQYVKIRSTGLSALPGDTRVGPSQVASMAKLVGSTSSTSSVIRTVQASGTGYWALEGIEIVHPASVSVAPNYVYTLVGLPEDSSGENQPALTPHHIKIDRSYIHGIDTTDGPARCIGAHGRNIEITNSYISNCKVVSTASDSQGIFIQNGQGPFYISNNYIEAAGENILIGQGPGYSAIPWLTQRFAFIQGNYSYKRREWKCSKAAGVPTWTPCLPGEKRQNTSTSQWYQCDVGGASWSTTTTPIPAMVQVKNHYENKEGQGVWYRGNVVDGNWNAGATCAGQLGNNFLINQSDTVQLNVRDITIDSNNVKYGQIFMSTGYFGTSADVFTSGVTVTNNLQESIATDLYGSNGTGGGSNAYIWSAQTRERAVTFDHNTFTVPGSGSAYYLNNITKTDMADGAFAGFLNFTNNAIWPGQYLFSKDLYPNNGWCSWRAAMANVGDLNMANNLIVGASGSYSTGAAPACPPYVDLPSTTVFGTDLATTYTSPSTNDWTMKAAGPGKTAATDGTDIGVDFTVYNAAIAGSVSGAFNGYLQAGFRAITPTSTTVAIQYTAPSTTTCTLAAALTKAFGATVGTPSTSQTGRSGTGSITGLSANTVYWLRLSCGSDRLYAQAITR